MAPAISVPNAPAIGYLHRVARDRFGLAGLAARLTSASAAPASVNIALRSRRILANPEIHVPSIARVGMAGRHRWHRLSCHCKSFEGLVASFLRKTRARPKIATSKIAHWVRRNMLGSVHWRLLDFWVSSCYLLKARSA
jgi:hypothetical protein